MWQVQTKNSSLFPQILWDGCENKKNRLSQAFLKQPAYSAETLKKLLQEQIPYNIKFGDCKKRVLVAATSLNTCSCQVFDSTHPHHRAIGAVDILLASSAAPTYFPPHSIPTPILEPETAPKHPTKTIWADGGLTCNNPAFECVATLLKDGCALKDIHVLSIANGRQPHTPDPTQYGKMGLIDWGRSLVPICMDVSSEGAHKKCQTILSEQNYLRIDPLLGEKIELDNYSKATAILLPLAEHVADENRDRIQTWLM